ncbi:MAG: 50S ribosomal protein L17 [Candidatus Enteromonas sp.]|nr:50S ribosomal protein L17 [bacterium]MDD6917837.1 50S ribosomal protein L17 [bacterium]MDY6100747.1 50S ribosomal protein L17 [Candidatus Enteromonas sp.]
MAAQGRKNVHGKAGVRFKAGYTAAKNKMMLRNVVTSLVLNEEVKVTSGVVKELKTLADHLVTLAKRNTLHTRRQAAAVLMDEEAVKKLFAELGPRFANRQGGYTKALKLGFRKGDSAEVCLVRWSDK